MKNNSKNTWIMRVPEDLQAGLDSLGGTVQQFKAGRRNAHTPKLVQRNT